MRSMLGEGQQLNISEKLRASLTVLKCGFRSPRNLIMAYKDSLLTNVVIQGYMHTLICCHVFHFLR